MLSSRRLIERITLGLFAIAALLAGVTAAEVAAQREMVIVIDKGDGASVISTRIDSEELGYDPFALVEGENRSITLDDGRTALLTRSADGLTISVDGEEVSVPEPPALPRLAGDEGRLTEVEEEVDIEIEDGEHKRVVIRRERRIEGAE